MPDCRGVWESRIYSKRAKKSPFTEFVSQSGITVRMYVCRADATGMDAMEHLSIGMEFHTWELFFIITAVHMVHYNYRVEGTGGGGLLTKLHTSKT